MMSVLQGTVVSLNGVKVCTTAPHPYVSLYYYDLPLGQKGKIRPGDNV